MILANGTKVFLTGGHYEADTNGWQGTVLAHRNSSRDGDSYIIEFGGHVGKVQVKAKFVREALAEVKTEEGVKFAAKQKHRLEGKWVIAPRGIKVFEESEAEEDYLVLTRNNDKKNVLVTLVYEDFGTTVANVVFQGQYAVVPADSLVFDEDSAAPGES